MVILQTDQLKMDRINSFKLRQGESDRIVTRTNRFFKQDDYWYFRTREGLDIGPFDSHTDAEAGFNGFMDFLIQAKSDVVTRITKYVKAPPRQHEDQPIPPRDRRFFEQNDYWYFRTREGLDIGPFDSEDDASEGAKGFVSFLNESQPDVVARVTHYIRAV